MRHLLLAGLAALALAAPAGPLSSVALAQDLRPVVIVNDRAVTRYELDQRLRFMQALRAPGADAASAEKSLIDERLEVEEARRMGIAVTEQQIQAAMTEFAGRANMDAGTFTAELARAGIDAQTFRDFVTAGALWREVLRARIAPSVSVSDREVAQARKRAIEEPRVSEVLISELIMPAPQGSEARVLARADELARTIGSEAAFAAAARRYSATASAPNGGRLNWTPISRLPQGLAPILLALKPGQVTQPLTIPGAVVLFYLRDTRGVQRPGAKAETVEYQRVTLPSAADAAAIQARSDTCDMMMAAARGRPVRRQTVASGAVPGDIAQVLSRLDPNETAIINRGGAVDLVMLCQRAPTLLAEADGGFDNPPIPGLPTSLTPRATAPEAAAPAGTPVAGGAAEVGIPGEADGFGPVPSAGEARDALFNRKVEASAAALLAELRANAIIRRP
ncbi:peptidylprolyl isomerase [Paracoccus suum]|uniref:Parvulin-like PPIase n=1 Tax=Paracoccus suum TaxID=2259340 RepID=A0A344PGH2_9RHOB|nr:peptidylprolyl isomerase [Paracoccus suum]AXC48477.1 peptidylprolyl isomerase [Paracoccus suum]